MKFEIEGSAARIFMCLAVLVSLSAIGMRAAEETPPESGGKAAAGEGGPNNFAMASTSGKKALRYQLVEGEATESLDWPPEDDKVMTLVGGMPFKRHVGKNRRIDIRFLDEGGNPLQHITFCPQLITKGIRIAKAIKDEDTSEVEKLPDFAVLSEKIGNRQQASKYKLPDETNSITCFLGVGCGRSVSGGRQFIYIQPMIKSAAKQAGLAVPFANNVTQDAINLFVVQPEAKKAEEGGKGGTGYVTLSLSSLPEFGSRSSGQQQPESSSLFE